MQIPPCSFVLVFGFLLSLGSLLAERKEPVLGTGIIDRLIAPETRSQAFREVQIAKQDEDPHNDWSVLPMAAFELYHQNILVTECPQLDATSPLYMVSYLWDHATYSRYYSSSPYRRSSGFSPVEDAHKPEALVDPAGRFSEWATSPQNPHLSLPPEGALQERVIVFLTSEGKVVWPFQGDNMTEGDVIQDLNGDGRYERVYSSNFGVYSKQKGEPDIWVQALRVEAVDLESTRLFYVLLNWQDRKSAFSPAWGWAVRDLDDDGVDEIVLGPIADEAAEPEVKVVYRWDAEQGQYAGPQGSYDDHYLLLDPKVKLWDELRRVKAAGGMRYEAIARANAPAVEAETVAAAPYDWRHREPYRHRSLAGASHAELLNFMCGWSPVVQASAGDADSIAVESESAKAAQTGTNHRFEFQAEWADLEPKAAMFAFVDTQQSHVHRNQYTLYYPTHLTQAERADWVVMSSLQGPGIQAIRSSGEGAGCYLSARYSRPLPEKYPAGDFNWKWKSARMDPERVVWLQESLWWLAQIRSEAKVREQGRYSSSSSFSTNCFPTYMETAPPAIRLLSDAGSSLIDIKAERASGYSSSWREEFGPEQYLGFADQLFQANRGTLLTERLRDVTLTQVLETMPTLIAELQSGRIAPQLAKAIVRSAGDSGDVSLLPMLKEIEALVPDRAVFELEWQRLSEDLGALPSEFDRETFKLKTELELQMAAIEQSMRDHFWSWLREPLDFAIQQLEVADDVAALSVWAQQPGEPSALWALARLRDLDVAAWQQVLSQVFREQVRWRKNIIRYLAYQDRELAQALVAELPHLQQLKLMPSLLVSQKPANMDDETIQSLLATIGADPLDAQTRVNALRQLVPNNDPHTIESIEVDQVLLEVLQTEMEPLAEPWPERYLVYDAALVLLLRNQVPLPVELYIKGADTGWNEFSFGSYLALMLHLAMVNESAQAREWLIQWAHAFIEKDAGAWGRFAEIVYAADLHQFGPFLERLATLDAQAQEGGSGIGKGRHPELRHDERYHRARQVAAVWSEPDALTRLKCELLLGLNFGHQFGPKELYSPVSRSRERLLAGFEQLPVPEREALRDFVVWCQSSIESDSLDYNSAQYFKWVVATFAEATSQLSQ